MFFRLGAQKTLPLLPKVWTKHGKFTKYVSYCGRFNDEWFRSSDLFDFPISLFFCLKVSKCQNEFMKSTFLPKYEANIVRISTLYCATLQGRNLHNFWFIFWEKQWLHKFILKFTDLYCTRASFRKNSKTNKINQSFGTVCHTFSMLGAVFLESAKTFQGQNLKIHSQPSFDINYTKHLSRWKTVQIWTVVNKQQCTKVLFIVGCSKRQMIALTFFCQ